MAEQLGPLDISHNQNLLVNNRALTAGLTRAFKYSEWM